MSISDLIKACLFAAVVMVSFLGGVLASQPQQLRPAPEQHKVQLIPASAIHRANTARSI